MAVRTARVPENLDLYLKILLSKGYAKTYGEAINLMILERMMKDKETGDISPFPYALVDNRKTTADLDIDKIETLNIRKNQSAPAEEAPPILDSYRFAGKASNLRDPGEATEIKKLKETKPGEKLPGWESKKPVFPGSKAEYEEALRIGSIKTGMFEPPE